MASDAALSRRVVQVVQGRAQTARGVPCSQRGAPAQVCAELTRSLARLACPVAEPLKKPAQGETPRRPTALLLGQAPTRVRRECDDSANHAPPCCEAGAGVGALPHLLRLEPLHAEQASVVEGRQGLPLVGISPARYGAPCDLLRRRSSSG